jgi:hypothetical protein
MATPAEQPANDNATQRYWRSVLADADADIDERMRAREQLAAIDERDGRHDAAARQLIANVQDGVMSVEILDWLSRVNRARGKSR